LWSTLLGQDEAEVNIGVYVCVGGGGEREREMQGHMIVVRQQKSFVEAARVPTDFFSDKDVFVFCTTRHDAGAHDSCSSTNVDIFQVPLPLFVNK